MSALPQTAPRKLLRHPDSPPAPVREISVSAARDGNHLLLQYRLEGDLGALLLPDPAEPRRADGLWRHTCFEAFVARVSSAEYFEYNFSPSGAWAAYHFSGYRADMRAPEMQDPPAFGIRREKDTLTLAARLDLRWTATRPGGNIHLGVTAVIEDQSGLLSYWALKHPPGKPDFHHADGFVLDVS